MKERELNILKLITSLEYIDGHYLAKEMNLSLRTIRYSIKNIREELQKYQCELLYSRRKGYYFSKSHKIKVEILIDKFYSETLHISDSEQRKSYILGKILFDYQININKVADISFCQKSLIVRDVQTINKEFKKYQTIIKKEQGSLYCYKLNLEVASSIFLNQVIAKTYIFKDLYNTKISILFFEIFNLHEFKYFAAYLKNTELIMYNEKIQIQVIWYSYYIFKKYINNITILKTYYYSILDLFKNNLSNSNYCLVKKFLKSIGYYKKLIIEQQLQQDIQSFFRILASNYQIKIDFSAKVFATLLEKIMEVTLRKQLKIILKLKNTARLIRLYPYSFSISQQLLGFIYQDSSFPRDDVAYIAEEIQELIFSSTESKALLIITDESNENIEYCKRWISYQYTKNLKIYELTYEESQKLLKNKVTKIKLILNFSNKKIISNVPYLDMDYILTIEQINKIDFILKNNLTNSEFLSKFFIQNSFKIFLNKVSLEEVITAASQKMYSNKYVEDWKKLRDKCLKREKIAPTYIGYNTMIIHPLNYFSQKNIVFLTISKEPIIIDNAACNIFFLCCFKEKIDFEISRLFEYILKIVENDKYKNILINAQSEMELIMDLNAIIKML
ncbi:MAG: PTS sugar transporter subunit IIA [Mycoplasmatales bacterium]